MVGLEHGLFTMFVDLATDENLTIQLSPMSLELLLVILLVLLIDYANRIFPRRHEIVLWICLLPLMNTLLFVCDWTLGGNMVV